MPKRKPRLCLPVSITLNLAGKISSEISMRSSISESERSASPPAWCRRSDVGTQRLRSAGVRSALPTQLRPASVSSPRRIGLSAILAAISMTGAEREGASPTSDTRVEAKTGAVFVRRDLSVGAVVASPLFLSFDVVLSVDWSLGVSLAVVPSADTAFSLVSRRLRSRRLSRRSPSRRSPSRLAFNARARESLVAWVISEGQSRE